MEDHSYASKKEKIKQQRERHNCCVPQCMALKTATNHLHRLPNNPKLRKMWAVAIKSAKTLSDGMQVCSRHFKSEDYIPTLGTRAILKRNVVPSKNLPIRPHDKVLTSPQKRKQEARAARARKRASRTELSINQTKTGTDKTSSAKENYCYSLLLENT